MVGIDKTRRKNYDAPVNSIAYLSIFILAMGIFILRNRWRTVLS